MPAASTSATNVATDGPTATGWAAATTVTGAGAGTDTGAGTTVVDGVVGVDAVEIAGKGTDVGVVVPSAAPMGVVRAPGGFEEGTDEARWGLSTMTAVRARVEARHAAMRRRGRLPRRAVRLILRLMSSTRPASDARRGAGEAGGALSTMC
jgi:hypothetical protein